MQVSRRVNNIAKSYLRPQNGVDDDEPNGFRLVEVSQIFERQDECFFEAAPFDRYIVDYVFSTFVHCLYPMVCDLYHFVMHIKLEKVIADQNK